MVLFINNFITKNGKHQYNRLNYAHEDRLQVWKYTLASYSVLPFTKVVMFCALDTPFQDKYDELEEYVKDLFNCPVQIFRHRNGVQKQWQEALALLDAKEPIWFCCNDDHIFTDYNLDTINSACDIVSKEPNSAFYYSHWPELLKMSGNKAKCFKLQDHGDFISWTWTSPCSIQIFNPALLHDWWHAKDYGEQFFPRSDWWPSIEPKPYTSYVALKQEVCRHFDGYTHIPYFDQTWCPPLFIPNGFFDKDIKIIYGSDEKKPGYININPLSDRICSAIDPNGPDFYWLLEEVPLFWKDRISDIIEYPIDRDLAVEKRNQAHLRKALSPHRSDSADPAGPINEEWIQRGFVDALSNKDSSI